MWINLLVIYLIYRFVLYPLAQGWNWWANRMGPRQIAAYKRYLDSIQFPNGRP